MPSIRMDTLTPGNKEGGGETRRDEERACAHVRTRARDATPPQQQGCAPDVRGCECAVLCEGVLDGAPLCGTPRWCCSLRCSMLTCVCFRHRRRRHVTMCAKTGGTSMNSLMRCALDRARKNAGAYYVCLLPRPPYHHRPTPRLHPRTSSTPRTYSTAAPSLTCTKESVVAMVTAMATPGLSSPLTQRRLPLYTPPCCTKGANATIQFSSISECSGHYFQACMDGDKGCAAKIDAAAVMSYCAPLRAVDQFGWGGVDSFTVIRHPVDRQATPSLPP